MQSRYKVIISNRNLYKEIDLLPDVPEVHVGTETDCEIRLRKDMFFESIVLDFVQQNDQWAIFCSDNLYIDAGDVRKLLTKTLNHGDVFSIKYQGSNNDVFTVEFLIDFDNGQRRYERAIDVSACSVIRIGVDNLNQIIIHSSFVRNDSIELNRTNNGYALKVLKTTYGVYHNGSKAVGNCIIKNGDFFSISDFIFYIKDGYIWTEIREGIVLNGLNCWDCAIPNQYPKFNRNTRVRSKNSAEPIEILDPPAKPEKPKNNLMMRLLPSLGMFAVSGVMAFIGGTTMIIFSAMSGGIAILTSILTLKEGKKEFKLKSAERISKYNSYIEKKRGEIKENRDKELSSLVDIYIPQKEERILLDSFSPRLFDRTSGDDDFLHVNLGNGDVEALQKIKYKKQEKLEIEDELQSFPEMLAIEFSKIQNAPVVSDFKSNNAIGIVGDENQQYDLLRNIIIDLSARHYHSDVKFVIVAEEEHADLIDCLRYLPYCYNPETGIRTIVEDQDSKNVVFEYLYKELSSRKLEKHHSNHIVVFFFDEFGFKNHPISKFVGEASDLDFTFVFFADKESDIPMGCGEVIELLNNHSGKLIKTNNSRNSTSFVYSPIPEDDFRRIVAFLTPVYTEEISLESSLTKNYSMFEMLNILAVDDIDLNERWNNSQVYKSMAAPLGISKSGMIYLDLHDKAHGPHGLVAGTTGSGKSEILQTYILSMATLFHPYEVAFVIIDFKGGGMVNQFKDLPHLLGAITNIDGKEIDRSLKSIKAELQKRQRLFAEADVNHIDKYIKKFKAGEVKTPLPHLILIVDEFAELKAEQPEFMKELISAARIGRSLGVHLILATQKPSGQVNEQIWSNSRFKLCLKVQSQEDSNEVLKSPLAAEIKEPGRAYLQVGNNEVFELFQSAYSGGPEKVDNDSVKEFSIFSVSPCGKRSVVYSQKRQKSDDKSMSQLDAVVKYVHDYCESIAVEKLPNICLPSLNDYISIPDNLGEYELSSVPLGIYDDPDSQYQGFANINLCDDNTMIIGASQTGKTNILQSIIRLSATRYSPKEVVFYIADFGAMYLKNFEKLHHVGGVVTLGEDEKLKNLFKLLTEEVQKRKTRFLESGLSSFSAYCDAGFDDLPRIMFIVDNFSAFKEVYSEAYEDQFVYILREGISCGISTVVTNSMTSGLGYKYMSNFANRIALKCNDSSEYMTIFDRCRIEPKDVPGRILCKINKELFEAQTFIAFEGKKEIERSNAIKSFVDNANSKYGDAIARAIPSIPDQLTHSYIEKNYTDVTLAYQYPIGLDYANVDVVVLDLREANEFCVIGRDQKKKLRATEGLLSTIHYYALRKPVELYIIDSVERKLKDRSNLGYVERYTIDYSEIGSILDDLMPELEERQQMLMDGEIDQLSLQKQIVILINNKDVIEYISSNKELLDVYVRICKQFKPLGISFIFTDIDDIAYGYNAPELYKRLKENKRGLITTTNLAEFKFCEIPSTAIRNNKNVNSDDSFIIDGSDISRIKLAEEEKK